MVLLYNWIEMVYVLEVMVVRREMAFLASEMHQQALLLGLLYVCLLRVTVLKIIMFDVYADYSF